jgi:DNA-binding response OmpR family regulator
MAEHLSNRPEEPFEVATAKDGFEAGRLVASLKPEVVLLDLRMPGMDGFQVCKTIKAAPESAGTVVIAMTGYHTPETEARILECGAVRCFAKPVDPETIASFIDSEFSRRSGTRSRRGRSARA